MFFQDEIGKETDVVLKFKGQHHSCSLFGKDAVITEINVEQHRQDFETASILGDPFSHIEKVGVEPVRMTLEIMITPHKLQFMSEIFNGKQRKKIRHKKVKDCSIQELLLAARAKISGEK